MVDITAATDVLMSMMQCSFEYYLIHVPYQLWFCILHYTMYSSLPNTRAKWLHSEFRLLHTKSYHGGHPHTIWVTM